MIAEKWCFWLCFGAQQLQDHGHAALYFSANLILNDICDGYHLGLYNFRAKFIHWKFKNPED